MPHILIQIFIDKLSNSSSRYLYARCGVNLTTDPVNPVAPQFVDHGLYTVDTLIKGAGIWSLDIRIRSSPDVTHWSAAHHDVGQSALVVDTMGSNPTIVKKTIKLILKFGWKIPNFNFSSKILKRVDHLCT